MQEPGARVVGFEGDGDEAVGGEEHDVAAWGVVVLGVEEGGVEWLGGLLEESEIMTVKVDLRTTIS